ncbi:MAG: response regulator [Methanomicrobiales archaeon]|nr:response regulator [Methanomicrobiales archaeon]
MEDACCIVRSLTVLTILLVDDEPDLLELAVRCLSAQAPDEILTAPSADAAFAILAAKRVDAIVSDYEMPKMDGIEFLKELRTRGDRTPFIIFTGKGREVVAMQALNFGADFYLQKGGDVQAQFAELRNMIEKAVERRRAVDEAKALAERVEHQAQILDEILSSIPEPVLIMDASGTITYANLSGAKILGFTRMTILGRHISELRLPAEAEQALRSAAGHVFDSGEKTVTAIPWTGGDGILRYRCTISPLHTTTGRINAVDIIFRDITEEARMAGELEACRTRVGDLLQGRKGPG